MTRVILDIPADKMQAFFQAVHPLGLGKGSMLVRSRQSKLNLSKKKISIQQRNTKNGILSDWHCYCNELEFE